MKSRFIKSEPGADSIIVEGFFPAPRMKVFQAWTDPAIVMKWFGAESNSLHSATIDLRKGGMWQFIESSNQVQSVGFEGQYLDIETNTRLVFTWRKFTTHSTGERVVTPHSQVEVTFSEREDGTLVRVVHSKIQDEDTRKHFGVGWNRSFETMTDLFT